MLRTSATKLVTRHFLKSFVLRSSKSEEVSFVYQRSGPLSFEAQRAKKYPLSFEAQRAKKYPLSFEAQRAKKYTLSFLFAEA